MSDYGLICNHCLIETQAYFAPLCRYREKGRLTITDMSRNLSRTMDSNTNQIIPVLQTNFNDISPIYLGGLPQGFLVSIGVNK